MASNGITFDQVVVAATQIQAQGLKPTIERVRQQLGSGSNTTINKYLTIWRGEQNETTQINSVSSPPDIVKIAAERAWLEIRKESEIKIEAIKEESAAQIVEAERRAEQAAESEARYKKELEELRIKYAQDIENQNLLNARLKRIKQQYDLVLEQNLGLEARMQDMQTHAIQIQHQLTMSHEKEVIRLMEQLNKQDKYFTHYCHELKLLEEKNEQLLKATIDELKIENKNLKANLYELQMMLKQNKIELTKLQKHFSQKNRAIRHTNCKKSTLSTKNISSKIQYALQTKRRV